MQYVGNLSLSLLDFMIYREGKFNRATKFFFIFVFKLPIWNNFLIFFFKAINQIKINNFGK